MAWLPAGIFYVQPPQTAGERSTDTNGFITEAVSRGPDGKHMFSVRLLGEIVWSAHGECGMWKSWLECKQICVIVGFDWSLSITFHLSKCLFNCHDVSDYITAVIGLVCVEDLHETLQVCHVKHRSPVITHSGQITWLMH